MLCKNCRQPLPYLAPATVTHCENCLLDKTFPGKTAIDLHLVCTMPKPAAISSAALVPPGEVDATCIYASLPKPRVDASDVRIAEALNMSISTVYIARLYNPSTYSFLLDMEARKVSRITSVPDDPAKLEPKPKKGELDLSDQLHFAVMCLRFTAITFIVWKIIFG